MTGFTTGGTNSPFYTGKHFADGQNAVVVTVNYRINIFGFPGDSKATTNIGLRDARLAVEWVRDNIQQFGGDPPRLPLLVSLLAALRWITGHIHTNETQSSMPLSPTQAMH